MQASTEDAFTQFTNRWWYSGRIQPPMIDQLYDIAVNPVVGKRERSSAKAATKPPYDINAMDFHYECVGACEYWSRNPCELSEDVLRKHWKQARVILGYDSAMMTLNSVSCHVCGSQLIVAEDASTSVSCVNCDVDYPVDSWIELLEQHDVDENEVVSDLVELDCILCCGGVHSHPVKES